MDLQSLYGFYRHYGVQEKSDDFCFEEDGVYITMKVINLEGTRRLFVLRNGEVVHEEELEGN